MELKTTDTKKASFLELLKSAHVVVAGEVGIDEYIWGETHRISPEAPVPVVEVQSQTHKLGLAANVAQNIASLGAKVTLVGVRGDDENGEELESMLKEAGIGQYLLVRDPSRPTLKKIRVIAQNQHVVRIDHERTHTLSDSLCKQFVKTVADAVSGAKGLVIEDYGKGLWNPQTVQVVGEAHRKSRPVFVDPCRHTSASLYRGVTLLTPNVHEAEILSGFRAASTQTERFDKNRLQKMSHQLMVQTEAEHVIITCGERGMVSLSQDDPELKQIPTYARKVADVTGAGDTVIAVLSSLMVMGLPLEFSMCIANAAAGIVVGQVGTATVSPQQLREEIERLHTLGLL